MRITWLLKDELALGTAPCNGEDLNRLDRHGVRGVLSLCEAEEALAPDGMAERFRWVRVSLPDHRHPCTLTIEQIEVVLAELTRLLAHGPVYLHCVAGVERSPLVAMAWLIHNRRMSWQDALDYVQETHPGTSPLPEQLAVLKGVPLLTTTAQNHWPAVA
ncbi:MULTISPECIES: dual specificity protein phosphatase family protein [unclassified Synechococcus]|uniref:protein-tyrosine phosphatase family protein n=1 Tax=unclassified Synechococcus TaxID=2626047 RepID=UPI0000699392|nr:MULTISPECIES: dual specificity protein phosphatase [unclassified Synechococcus]EAQ75981.1 hypothetical protein WH5701_14281 [Synechococcus sp. WH 5701]WFN58711.1 dual specificity protein phosphatase [Synechococcus sp. CCFWC 502]